MAYRLLWKRAEGVRAHEVTSPASMGGVHQSVASPADGEGAGGARGIDIDSAINNTINNNAHLQHVDLSSVQLLETRARASVELEQRLARGWIGSQWSNLHSKKPSLGPHHATGCDVSVDGNSNSTLLQGFERVPEGSALVGPRPFLSPLPRAGSVSVASVAPSAVNSRHTSMRSFKRHRSHGGSHHGGAGAGRRASLAARDAWEQGVMEAQLLLLEEEEASRTMLVDEEWSAYGWLAYWLFYDPFYDDGLAEKEPESPIFQGDSNLSAHGEWAAGSVMPLETPRRVEAQRLRVTTDRALCICWVSEYEQRRSIFDEQKRFWRYLIAAQSPFSSYFSRRAGVYEAAEGMWATTAQLHSSMLQAHGGFLASLTSASHVALDRLFSRQRAELLLHMAWWAPQTQARERLERARLISYYHPFFLPFSGPHRTAVLSQWFGKWLLKGQRRCALRQKRVLVTAMAARLQLERALRYYSKWCLAREEGAMMRRLGVIRMAAEDALRLVYLDTFRFFVEAARRRREQRRRIITLRSNALTEITSRYLNKWRKHNRSAPNRARLTGIMVANHNVVRGRYFDLLWGYIGFQRRRRQAIRAAEDLRILNLQHRNNALVQGRYYTVWSLWAAPRIVASTMERRRLEAEEEAALMVIVRQEMADALKQGDADGATADGDAVPEASPLAGGRTPFTDEEEALADNGPASGSVLQDPPFSLMDACGEQQGLAIADPGVGVVTVAQPESSPDVELPAIPNSVGAPTPGGDVRPASRLGGPPLFVPIRKRRDVNTYQ